MSAVLREGHFALKQEMQDEKDVEGGLATSLQANFQHGCKYCDWAEKHAVRHGG